jgi:hypothetical protein
MKKLLCLILLMSCGGFPFLTGSKPQPENLPDSQPENPPEPKICPANLSWGDIDTNGDGVRENYLTSIKSQLCGDCFIYAAVGLVEIQYQIDHNIQVDLNLSEQNLHNCLRFNCGRAGDARRFLRHIRDYGIMEEYHSPTGFWNECKNCSLEAEMIPFFSIGDYEQLELTGTNKREIIVKALQNGPVAVSIDSWDGFEKHGDTLYCTSWKPSGHWVIVAGYQDYGKVLLTKNSHKEDGLTRIAFEDSEVCGLGGLIIQIDPGSTYMSWGTGQKFCHSVADFDEDGIADAHDNCPWETNVDQKNIDGDLFGDVCDQCPDSYNPTTGAACGEKK